MTTQEKIEAIQKDLEDSLFDWSAYGIKASDDIVQSVHHTETGIVILFKDGSKGIISK